MSSEVNYASSLEGRTLTPPGSNSSLSLPGSGVGSIFGVSDGDVVSTAIVGLPNVSPTLSSLLLQNHKVLDH
jgi:hypothetical protein